MKKLKEEKKIFHKVDVAEKVNHGIVYFYDDKIFYDKNGSSIEIASNVSSLWREDNDIYYVSDKILYNYNFETMKTKKLVENPHTILGKYNDNIISYSGKTIYSINGESKTKLFKNGYYLNKAVLYKNRVYGIPASNVYEYNLDTLKVKKITNDPASSQIELLDNELWIVTTNHKNKKNDYTYSKMTDDRLQNIFTIKNVEYSSLEKATKKGIIFSLTKSLGDSPKGNKLIYFQNGKIRNIDKNYNYYVIGIFDNKLCYYKNDYIYGTEQDNLKTFYLYDGKKNTKIFNLNVGYYESIDGYEYDNGLLIAISYEVMTILYKYSGNNIEKIELPNNFYRIVGLDVIDNRAYIRYIESEESVTSLSTIINLK